MGLDPNSPELQEAAKKANLQLPPPNVFLGKLIEEVEKCTQAGYACEGLWVDANEEGIKRVIEKLKSKDFKAVCVGFGQCDLLLI